MKNCVIWVVDDESIILKALSSTISYLGHQSQCFSTAEECLAFIDKEQRHLLQCHLLITDINLPGIDGLSLLEKVKDIKPLLPVLIITGYGDIPLAVKAIKKGAFDFIEKPLNEDTLVPSINLALSHHKLSEKFSLTDSELLILKHVAMGKSSKEISEILSRSVRTIDNHKLRMMKKIGIKNSTSLVNFAYSIGLAPNAPQK
jgi:two-component system, LuxR family, response regulator FixJ